jgi:hypothetical protein
LGKVVIEKTRDVRMYAEMWHTSEVLLMNGKENAKGCTHQFRASLVFTAFTLEAYLNHIGKKLFKCWDDLDRLRPKEKLNVVADRIGLQVDYGRQPWQIVQDLFGFRNKIAHGRSEELSESVPLDKYQDEVLPQFVLTDWEKDCNEKKAERAREHVKAIVHSIHEAANIPNEPFPFVLGAQFRNCKGGT